MKLSLKTKNNASLRHFEQMQDTPRRNIEISKQEHFSNLSSNLTCNKINPKFYWTILKSLPNSKKISYIPPLIHNNKLVTDLEGKK